jgi:hypothetical protein
VNTLNLLALQPLKPVKFFAKIALKYLTVPIRFYLLLTLFFFTSPVLNAQVETTAQDTAITFSASDSAIHDSVFFSQYSDSLRTDTLLNDSTAADSLSRKIKFYTQPKIR